MRIYALHLTSDEVKEFCTPGKGADTCAWLLIGSNGWECCCLHKPKILIERFKNKKMVALRDGCEKVNEFEPQKFNIGEVNI